jgi:hypothetical protein
MSWLRQVVWPTRGSLREWLQREGRRQAARPDLLSALIGGRSLAYVRQRLGFVVLRLLLRSALHLLEVLFLSRALPFEYLAPLLSYRALAALATNLHWGASESLREQVRACLRLHKPALARASVEAWLGNGTRLAALPLLWVAFRVLAGNAGQRAPGISLFDAYALACCLRLLFDLYARTYHAGVFAVRRVYRPLGTLLCADLLEVSLIVFGFDALGAWSIPLATVLGGALDAALVVHYARAAYLRRGLLAPRWRRALFARPSFAPDVIRGALVQSLAGASLQLDAWLLLLLVRVDPPRAGVPSLALVFYVLRPLLALATHWVRTFYFDLTRIEAGALRDLRPHLLRLLRRLAFGCALFGAALTLGVARVVWPELAVSSLLWLVPFSVVRSLFALAQLQAFTRQHVRQLVWTSVALGVGLSALAALSRSGTVVLGGASLALLIGFGWLRESSAKPRGASSDGPVLGVAEWLRTLRASGPVRIAVLRVARGGAPVGRVVQTLAAAHPELRLSRHGHCHVLLLAAAESAPAPDQLVASAAGALAQLWISPVALGCDCVGIARAEGVLPVELHAALNPCAPDSSTASLLSAFQREFPSGGWLDLTNGSGRLDPCRLPADRLGDFLHQLNAASRQRDHEVRRALPFELAAYAPAGRAALVFVVARGTPGFAAFRASVRSASLRASFYVEPVDRSEAPRRWSLVTALRGRARS